MFLMKQSSSSCVKDKKITPLASVLHLAHWLVGGIPVSLSLSYQAVSI